MEAGERWMMNDVTGKAIRAWDSRGHDFATEYDRLRRPTRQKVHGTDATQSDQRTLNKDIVFAKTEYGENQSRDVALNLRTRVYRQYDGAGIMTNEAYDFKGNLLRSSRQVAPEYKEIVNWATAQPAGETFSSSTTYDALNRPTALVAPDNSVLRPAYNEANLLNALEANLRGAASVTKFVTNIDYNAKGQRELIQYGNGVETHYGYDPDTFRLINLYTRRGAQFKEDCENSDPPPPETIAAPEIPPLGKACGVQNLHYTYDPAGNITHIRDDAQDTIFFRNKRVEPSNNYIYDAIYQLIEATGRERLGQAVGGTPLPPKPSSYNDWLRIGLPHPGDGNAMGKYREIYTYDEVGNFCEMVHRGTDPAHEGWTRTFTYEEPSLFNDGAESNRLTSTSIGSITEVYSRLVEGRHDGYDAHGNMLRMPQLQVLRWDFQDRLLMTQRQKVNDEDADGAQHHGERTWYVYDASGQRVRKVTDRGAAGGQTPTRMKERIYVGAFEIYREYGSAGEVVTLERETLHVMDDKQRIALVDTKFISANPLIRYQFGNHLGSACLELDDQARVVSYEEYTPYGSTTHQSVQQNLEVPSKRYRYADKERDEESGLQYYGARYSAAWLSRWVTPDPAGLIDGVDSYVFVGNNPITMRDKSGLQGENTAEDLFLFLRNDAAFAEGKANPQVIDEAAARANSSQFGMNAQKQIEQSIKDARAARIQGAEQVYSEVAVEHGTGKVEKIGGSPVRGADNLDLVKMPDGSPPLKEGDVLRPGDAELVGDVKHGKGSVTKAHARYGARGGVTVSREVKPRRASYTPPKVKPPAKAPQKSPTVQLTPRDAALDRSTGRALAKESKLARAGTESLEKASKGAKALAKLGKAGRHLAAAVPVLGIAAGQASAAYSASQGDYVGAALDEAGFIPVVGDVLDAGRAGYALGEAANELLVDEDLAMKHGDVAKATMQKLGAGETISNIAGGIAAAGSAIGQVLVKASPIGFLFR
jgi:RHS repeat-associated protein